MFSPSLVLQFRGANPRSDKKLRLGKSMLWALPATAGGTGQPTGSGRHETAGLSLTQGACLAGQTWMLRALLVHPAHLQLGWPKGYMSATVTLLGRTSLGPNNLPGGKRVGEVYPGE